jgi:hypothetical protein
MESFADTAIHDSKRNVESTTLGLQTHKAKLIGDTQRGRLCCCLYRQESRKPKKNEQQLCNALHNTTPPTSFSQPPGVKVQMKPCLRPSSSSSSSSFLLVVVVLLRFVSPSPTITLSPFHSWRKPNQKNKK